MSNVIGEIEQERERQMDKEGWTPEHDDTHTGGELAMAASLYAKYTTRDEYRKVGRRYQELKSAPAEWPWAPLWWKPKTRRRDLVRAAALIVAEIERLDREQARQERGL